mmetsp:Transcript_105974/g.309961  ORF Transcript_105974/g.309961 Transcript_105974/m.309961 type:complete len:273 (-) Transcript_105974:65-883(-)
MWWLIIPAVLFFFRGKIAQRLAPWIPDIPPQKTVLYGHLVMVGSALVYILPLEFVGLGAAKRVAYLVSLWSVVGTSILTIKANYGGPPMPANITFSNFKQVLIPALQPWLQQVMMGADFSFLFFALIFLPAYPSIVALLILGRHRLWHVCTYCSKNLPENKLWLKFAPYWAMLKAKEPQVLSNAALAEILLAFWLTVSLFLPTRQIITCFLYWNYLRTRFQIPRSHELHAQAWRQIGQKAEPLLKALPPLQKPIDMAKGWFKPQYQYQTRSG